MAIGSAIMLTGGPQNITAGPQNMTSSEHELFMLFSCTHVLFCIRHCGITTENWCAKNTNFNFEALFATRAS